MKLKPLSFTLLTLAISIALPTCHATQVASPPTGYDSFYKKYLDCDGIPVISSDKVDDRAFYRLKLLLDKVLENRKDVRQALINEGFKYIIIAQEEEVTDIPEYSHMEPKEYWNQRARGFGGKTTSCGEENLLLLPGDRYFNESIFIHELAHGVHLTGLTICEPGFQAELEGLYKNAMDKGLYKNDYAATNAAEYWAESFQAFFDCDNQNNFVHNHVNTRAELIEYDKGIADFIARVMRINDDNTWSYYSLVNENSIETPPAQLSHDGLIKKYIWCAGFPIIGTKNTNNEDLLIANNLVKAMYNYRYDILKIMTANNSAIVIYNKNDGYITGENDKYIEIETGTLIRNNTPLPGNLGKLVYQLALAGFYHIDDQSFKDNIKTVYTNNKEKWSANSQRYLSNEKIYFATGVQLYFDAGSILSVNSREKLQHFDPDLAKIVQDTFKYPNQKKWRLGSGL